MSANKLGSPQDTFDLLIFKTVALGAIHCHAIVQHLQRVSERSFCRLVWRAGSASNAFGLILAVPEGGES